VQGVMDITILKRLMDSMTVPVHPDACGALKKTACSPSDVPEED
jgi:hypothetical protein